MSVINDDIRVGGDMDRITKLVNCFPNGIKLSIHIGALWTEGPFEKFQFYVLPMKNQFFFSGILLDNSLTFKMTCWNCM